MSKKYLMIGGVAIITSLASCGGFMHHHCSANRVNHIMEHIDDKVEDLDLTAEQQVKYNGIREKMVVELQKSHQKRMTLMKKANSELKKEAPDVNMLIADARTMAKDMPADINAKIDLFSEFYAILNDRQKKELQEEVREKLERCDD